MDQAVKFYKQLADNTRLTSLMLIFQHKHLCVCEITAALAMSQPKISRHLAQLRQAEVILNRRQGLWVYYFINPDLTPWMLNTIVNVYHASKHDLHEDNKRLNQYREQNPDICLH